MNDQFVANTILLTRLIRFIFIFKNTRAWILGFFIFINANAENFQITAYGEQVTVNGYFDYIALEENGIIKLDLPNDVLILTLDSPIDTLPMPKIPGEETEFDIKINEMVLYIPPFLQSFVSLKRKHVKLRGSIWYADWFIPSLPFLLIVDEIYQIPP